MTKKDYELIAEAIHRGVEEHRRAFGEDPHPQISVFAERIADALALDNPRFHRRTFLQATGLWA